MLETLHKLAAQHPVIVTGTAGSISHYSEAQLVVQGDITGSIPSNSAPVSVGNSATFNLTLSSVGGLSGQFTFSCVNPPLGLTCALNPTSAMLSANGTVGTTLTVTVNSKPSSAISPSHPVQWPTHGRQIVAQAPPVLALLLLLLRHARPFRDSQVAVRVLMFAFGILVLTQVCIFLATLIRLCSKAKRATYLLNEGFGPITSKMTRG